jgi:anti-anti-sigma factor
MTADRAWSANPMAWWHIIARVGSNGQPDVVLTFNHSPVTIGGSPTSDVVLADQHVSRTHATVTLSKGTLLYRDHSSNGSFLNGQRVTEIRLDPDDVVVVGRYSLKFSFEVDEEQFTQLLARRPEIISVEGPDVAPTLMPHQFELRLTKAPGELSGRLFVFEKPFESGATITVGRSGECQVSLDLQSVSRRHAVFTLLPGGRWQVVDLKSRNGTAVNGQSIEAAIVSSGDEVGFGPDVIAKFRQTFMELPVSAPRPSAEPAPAVTHDGLLVVQRRSTVSADVAVVQIRGRVDGYNYAELRDQLTQIVDAGEQFVLLDFSHCSFCDHAGLGVVLSARTVLNKRKGRLCLTGVNQMLREALLLLRIDTLLPVESNEAAAVRRLLDTK